jgi:DNA polymerase-1
VIVQRLQEVSAIIEHLRSEPRIALDTETTGLKESDRLFSLIMSVESVDYYFSFNTYNGTQDALPLAETFKLLEPLFSDPSKRWYLQNAKFDMHMLAKEGSFLAGEVWCCAALARVLRNNWMDHPKPYSMEAQAKRIGLAKDDKAKEAIKTLGLSTKVRVPGKKKIVELLHYDQVPANIMFPYGAQDGYITFRLGEKYRKDFEALGTLERVAANERRLTKTCFKIERQGILIDPEYTRKAWDYEEGLIREASDNFYDNFGQAYPDTPAKAKKFFQQLGIVLPQTAKGNDSLDAKALEGIDHPAARLVEDIREREKRISTYYSSFLWERDSANVIRADMVQYGTETGRFSYRSPNLQNLPKEDEPEDLARPYQVRGCFVPRPGLIYTAIDYAQQEYRMMLDYAGEKKLIDLVMAGMDLHQATAEMVGITRKQAKTLNFAILYGAGPAKLALMLKISVTQAQHLIDKYYSRLPKVQQFVYKVTQKGKSARCVTNWMGRNCHVATPQWAYILPNHLIQGGCSDVIKLAMNQIQARLEDLKSPIKMLLTVHDEILFEMPPESASEISWIVPLMESIYPAWNGMKLTVDVSHSFKSYSAKDKVRGLP